MKIWRKLWPLSSTQGFSIIWPSDLVFDPRWLKYNSSPDFIKTNIFTKFHENLTKTMTFIAYSRFFYNLTWLPTFWPQLIDKKSKCNYHQNKQSNQILCKSNEKYSLYCIHKVSLRFDLVTYFLTPGNPFTIPT